MKKFKTVDKKRPVHIARSFLSTANKAKLELYTALSTLSTEK
jgi:hypothetical protein